MVPPPWHLASRLRWPGLLSASVQLPVLPMLLPAEGHKMLPCGVIIVLWGRAPKQVCEVGEHHFLVKGVDPGPAGDILVALLELICSVFDFVEAVLNLHVADLD